MSQAKVAENQSYRMLIAVCDLVIKGLLQTQKDGSTNGGGCVGDYKDMSSVYVWDGYGVE